MDITMTSLSLMACILGPLFIVLSLPCIFWPGRVREGLLAFPRSRFPALALTAVDVAWVMIIVLRAPLGRFEWIKPYLYVAGPVAYLLLIFFMDELLAPRALGGFLLLAANPVLQAARWHASNLRLVVTVLAYVWVVAGILLVLGPYYFRRMAEWSTSSETRCRRLGIARLALGGVLLALGLFVY